MADHQRQRFPFIVRGMDLTRPLDRIRDFFYPYLKNVRPYRTMAAEPRPGLTSVATSASDTPLHSARRLNDETTSSFLRILGASTKLLTEASGTITERDDGFSGDPLSMIPFRPSESPRPWMYVADRSRMRKVNQSATVHQVGLPPPGQEPEVELAQRLFKVIDDMDYASDVALQAAWSESSDAGAMTRLQWRTDTTISFILYDHGSTGWCMIEPVAMTGIHRNALLEVNGAEDTIVSQVNPDTPATAIASILYESGSSGLCSIVLTKPIPTLMRNCLLHLDSGGAAAEKVRILSASLGGDGSQSLRCVTSNTQAAGNSAQGIACFRCYLAGTFAATNTVRSDAARTATTYSSGKAIITRTVSIDLSCIGDHPVQPQDEFHISLRIFNFDDFLEGRLLFDVDEAVNDFTKNFYEAHFTPSDLAPAVYGDQTYRDVRADQVRSEAEEEALSGSLPEGTLPETQEEFLGDLISPGVTVLDPGPTERIPPPSGEFPLAEGEWMELTVKSNALTRAGTDLTRNLSHTAAVRVELRFASANSTADVDSIWLAGGFGPDVGDIGAPYVYRYRYRCSSTGVRGNHSPPFRNGVMARRQPVYIGCQGSSIAEVDRIDVSRWGGTILQWRYVGSIRYNFADLTVEGATNATPIVITSTAHGLSNGYFVYIEGITGNTAANGFWKVANKAADTFELVRRDTGANSVGNGVYGSGGTIRPAFEDKYPDEQMLSARPTLNDSYQPWPVEAEPDSGALTQVSGTLASGSGFNTSWGQGTILLVDGIAHVVYRVHSSSLVELFSNAGKQASVEWEVPLPLLLAQPLPVLWGPMDGLTFACGDPKNAGRLYFSHRNNPDATLQTRWLEITSPSEPLMNGFVYNGRSYAFSSERLFAIYADPGPSVVAASEIPNSKGLFARWGIAVGPKVWFVARDGIYETEGGAPRSITVEDLLPLFPHEGQSGQDVNGIPAPDFTSPDSMRLAYYDDWLYFTYQDADSQYRTLAYWTVSGGWFYDEFFDNLPGEPVSRGLIFYYGEEGKGVHSLLAGRNHATDAVLVEVAGADDEGKGIACQLQTPSFDAGDPRSRKRWADALIEAEAPDPVTCAAYIDDHAVAIGVKQVASPSRMRKIMEFKRGEGELARNLSLLMSFSSTRLQPGVSRLYGWEPSWLARPEDTGLRRSDWHDAGYAGHKEWRGCVIEADTGGIARTVQLYGTDGTLLETLSINHDGHRARPYAFTPFLEHLVQVRPADAAEWRLFSIKWITDPKGEEGIGGLYTAWQALNADLSPAWVQGVTIRARSDAAVSVQVQRDDPDAGAVTEYTLSVDHSGASGSSGESVRFYPFREDSHLSGGTGYSDGDKGPFIARLVRLAPQADIEIIGEPVWKFRPRPHFSTIVQDWAEGGYRGSKLLQGFRLKGDTRGSNVSMLLQRDGGTDVESFTVNHSGVQRQPYSLATPVLCQNFRLVPADGGNSIKDWIEEIEWVHTPAPDLTATWETLPSSHGLHGFQHLIDGYIALISSAAVTLTLTFDDGTSAAYSIASTSGSFKKPYLHFAPKKFKSLKYRLASASPFRLFKGDCELRVKPWGGPGPYLTVMPFGGPGGHQAQI